MNCNFIPYGLFFGNIVSRKKTPFDIIFSLSFESLHKPLWFFKSIENQFHYGHSIIFFIRRQVKISAMIISISIAQQNRFINPPPRRKRCGYFYIR